MFFNMYCALPSNQHTSNKISPDITTISDYYSIGSYLVLLENYMPLVVTQMYVNNNKAIVPSILTGNIELLHTRKSQFKDFDCILLAIVSLNLSIKNPRIQMQIICARFVSYRRSVSIANIADFYAIIFYFHLKGH